MKIYPDDPKSVWSTAFANKNTSFESNGTMGLDARVLYYFNAGGVTPAMAATRAGEGSDYALALLDANQQAFDGSKTYKLHLPPNVPVNDFWAVTIYDTQTRSQLQTSQKFPTVGSQTEGIKKNADGSYDIYFAPPAAQGPGRQLAADGTRQELVHHPAHVRPLQPGSTRPGGRARSNWCGDALPGCRSGVHEAHLAYTVSPGCASAAFCISMGRSRGSSVP